MLGIVGAACDPRSVEVTAADIARVPPGNIRVPRADFAAVWTAAERTARNDWYKLPAGTPYGTTSPNASMYHPTEQVMTGRAELSSAATHWAGSR